MTHKQRQTMVNSPEEAVANLNARAAMTPRDPLRDCEHRTIETYSFTEGEDTGKVALWACTDCMRRFEPRFATPTPDALDVEALRDALLRVEWFQHADSNGDPEEMWTSGELARRVATEYDAIIARGGQQ